MKNKTYVLNSILACVLGMFLLVLIFVRALAPQIILPKMDLPMLTLISLIALVLDHYLAPGAKRCYICIPVFSAITFGLMSFAAYLGIYEALRLAVLGCVVFTATTWLFTSMQDRLSTGPAAKASAALSAVSLYLAVQAFCGIL